MPHSPLISSSLTHCIHIRLLHPSNADTASPGSTSRMPQYPLPLAHWPRRQNFIPDRDVPRGIVDFPSDLELYPCDAETMEHIYNKIEQGEPLFHTSRYLLEIADDRLSVMDDVAVFIRSGFWNDTSPNLFAVSRSSISIGCLSHPNSRVLQY